MPSVDLKTVLKVGVGLIGLLGGAGGLAKVLRGTTASSWTDVSKSLRVEPVTLVDERCLHLPYLRDVLYTATATTAAYYLQAVAVQGTVGKLDVVRTLDGLNPNRDTVSNVGFLIGDAAAVSMQSARPRLPMYDTLDLQSHINTESRKARASMEAKPQGAPSNAADNRNMNAVAAALGTHLSDAEQDGIRTLRNDYAGNIDKDALKAATDIANLSVGSLISVELADGNEKRRVPVVVRLIVSAIKPNILSNIMEEAANNRQIKERYHAWRSGQISFIRDMILCQDVIDKDIKNRIEDKSGAWREMKDRQSNNRLNGLLSLGTRPSIGTACNVYVISKDTLLECEAAMGGRISNPAVRQKIFNNTLMMLLYVIDTKREMVEVWHRGQGTSTLHSIKEMKLNGKERNATIELNEAFKAYTGTGF